MLKISPPKTLILFMAAIMLLFMACIQNNKKYADGYYEQKRGQVCF